MFTHGSCVINMPMAQVERSVQPKGVKCAVTLTKCNKLIYQ